MLAGIPALAATRIPIEFCFAPSSESDVQALKKLPMCVSPDSNIYADIAIIDYTAEHDTKNAGLVHLPVQCKSNASNYYNLCYFD